MPLSEHEQRLLDQIERELYAEDPKFASTVRGKKLSGPSKRRRLEGIAVFVIGVALLVLGVIVPVRVADVPLVSVFGFLVMFTGAVLTLYAFRKKDSETQEQGSSKGGAAKQRSSFAQRMEERFRQRFEDR